jgi:uncharacterized tellurite resistance protein B-like protein
MWKWLDKLRIRQVERFKKDSRNDPEHVANECLNYQRISGDIKEDQSTAEIYSRLLENELQLGKKTLEEISAFLEEFQNQEKIYRNAVKIAQRNPEHLGRVYAHFLNKNWGFFVKTHKALAQDYEAYTQKSE